jgi:hypothetical protein
MSQEEVQRAQFQTNHGIYGSKAEVKRAKPNFINEFQLKPAGTAGPAGAIGSKKFVEFHYKNDGAITNDTNGSYAMKKEFAGGTTEYYLKYGTVSFVAGAILNPWGIHFNPGDEFKEEREMGRKMYEFKQVSKDSFESYIKFLKTKNVRHILNSERNI